MHVDIYIYIHTFHLCVTHLSFTRANSLIMSCFVVLFTKKIPKQKNIPQTNPKNQTKHSNGKTLRELVGFLVVRLIYMNKLHQNKEGTKPTQFLW